MLTRIVVWWSAMTAATGLAWNFTSLFVVRLLFGMGEAGAFPGIARAFSRWLPASSCGRVFGMAIMAGVVGGALTQPLVVALLGVVSWRRTFALFGLVGCVWAIGWFLWFRDDPAQHPAVSAAELVEIRGDGPQGDGPRMDVHPRVRWKHLFRNRALLALCLMYGGAIYGWYFYRTCLPQCLLRARGFDLRAVGWLAALPHLSIGAGVMTGGWLSDRLIARLGARAGRRVPGLVGLPLAAAMIVLAVSTGNPRVSAMALALAAGCAPLAVAPAWVVCLEIGGPHAGVVTSAMNTFGNAGGAISPIVVGLCLDRWGSWNAPLVTVAILYGLASLCWLAIDPADAVA